ncbi:MAG: helix-turn-helix domain-containing protein [Chthoniobacterales bacterium]
MWRPSAAISPSSATTDPARPQSLRCRPIRPESGRKECANTNTLLQEGLRASPLVDEFISAFLVSTGIFLDFLEVGSGEAELLQTLQLHPFGALLVRKESEHLRCPRRLKNLIREATASDPAEVSASILGVCYLAMPLRGRGSLIGILLLGPMFPHPPRPYDWMRASRRLSPLREAYHDQAARDTYFAIPVVSPTKLDAIIRLLSMFADHLSESARRLSLLAGGTQPRCVARAKEFIQEKSTEPLKVAHVAQRVAVHPDYLGKLFKNATGMTLTEYVARVRIENVKEQLPEPSCRVAEAAFAAGYQSLAQFNRDFKRYTGVCPRRYRASLLAGQLFVLSFSQLLLG